MGTRGEIYIRSPSCTIELWRHFDSYAEYMVPYFKGFAAYAAWCASGQTHLLTYPEDLAAMVVAYDYECTLAAILSFDLKYAVKRPDARPRGRIDDFEWVWILDIPEEVTIANFSERENIVWVVRGYVWKAGDSEEMRAAIRERRDGDLKKYLKKKVEFRIEPKAAGGGCRICGYPGPLMALKDPPICAYCLLKIVRRDDFIRSEVERAIKVAPLISSPE